MSSYQPERNVTGVDHLSEDKGDGKGDAYAMNVLPVPDLETGGDAGKHGGEIIPEGVDPNLIQNEQVHRGLKQRHIQVSQLYKV